MYLLENMDNIYENAVKDSVEYKVSEFILMHENDIMAMSLSEIASQLKMSKSSVASFFLDKNVSDGFPRFKKSLQASQGLSSVILQKHADWMRAVISEYGKKYACMEPEGIALLSRQMIMSSNVLFIGPRKYRDYFNPLIGFLRICGIRSRYMQASGLKKFEKELSELKDEELVIFFNPFDTYREYLYKMNSITPYDPVFNKIRGTKLYICRKSVAKTEDNVIPVVMPVNPYENDGVMTWLTSKLFITCLENSGEDTRKLFRIL